MAGNGFKRKLAAILYADVEGYSRLMDEDEEGTVKKIKEFKELMSVSIRKHHGRVVDDPGDNLMAEFSSVVNAVSCAVQVQKNIRDKNAALPENRRMIFRIGINLGDVIEEANRLYGDGVHVAARIEPLAKAGGICISQFVYDQIKNKLPMAYEYIGEHKLKNIKKAVGVYRVRLDNTAKNTETKKLHHLPAGPSIAVLPFDNMSGDPKQDFFCDGITEGVITNLSKTPLLIVMARHSTFAYKDKPVKVQQIGRELEVAYIMEGGVQKASNRVRITVQLIDARTGHHVWAETYDRNLEDIFALQDEISLEIVTALQAELTIGEQALTIRKGTKNIKTYIKILKGFEYYGRFNIEGNHMARKIAKEIIALAPDYPKGYVLLAFTRLRDGMFGWSATPDNSIKEAENLAAKAFEMDDSSATTHALLGNIYLVKNQHDKAVAALEQALNLNPNRADTLGLLGMVLNYAGSPQEAMAMFNKAIRLSPIPRDWHFHQLAVSYILLGDYDNAIKEFRNSLNYNPDNLPAHLGLAAIFGLLDRKGEAQAEAFEILRLDAKFSIKSWEKILPSMEQTEKNRLIDGLRKAGLK